MKVNTIMNLACIRLDVKSEDFVNVLKHKPEATILYSDSDDEKIPLYKLDIAEPSALCCIETFGELGAVFIDVDNTPVCWICLPGEALEDKSGFIAEEYGATLSNIKIIENQIKVAAASVRGTIASLRNDISDVFHTDGQDVESTN